MQCIFCLQERPPSSEHVFPLAMGGTVKTDRVCKECNSTLGARVDAALSDFLPVRMHRARLGITTHSDRAPGWYKPFLGQAKLVGEKPGRLETKIDKETGKLKQKLLYEAANVILPNGQKTRQIRIDASDVAQIPTIIKRERARHKMPPLSDADLATEAQKYTMSTIEHPLVQKELSVSFAYLQHAILKITYELAFMWLGDEYLTDPVAELLRAAIMSSDLAAADELGANIVDARDSAAFAHFWMPHEAHHLAYASLLPGQVIIAVRVFDLYASGVAISQSPERYFRNRGDREKLRFLAIDAISGKTIDKCFDEETHRLSELMRVERRKPPFSDPL